jgi:hypothetical protein
MSKRKIKALKNEENVMSRARKIMKAKRAKMKQWLLKNVPMLQSSKETGGI